MAFCRCGKPLRRRSRARSARNPSAFFSAGSCGRRTAFHGIADREYRSRFHSADLFYQFPQGFHVVVHKISGSVEARGAARDRRARPPRRQALPEMRNAVSRSEPAGLPALYGKGKNFQALLGVPVPLPRGSDPHGSFACGAYRHEHPRTLPFGGIFLRSGH